MNVLKTPILPSYMEVLCAPTDEDGPRNLKVEFDVDLENNRCQLSFEVDVSQERIRFVIDGPQERHHYFFDTDGAQIGSATTKEIIK